MSITTEEMEATRVGRFATMPIINDAFDVSSWVPNALTYVRKFIGRGIMKDPAKKPTIGIDHPFSMTLVEIPPGQGAPLHAHSTEEVFLVVEGEMTFFWGDNREHEIKIGKFDLVTMPIGEYRGFVNRTDKVARMFITVAGTDEETMAGIKPSAEVVAWAKAAGIKAAA